MLNFLFLFLAWQRQLQMDYVIKCGMNDDITWAVEPFKPSHSLNILLSTPLQ